MLSINLTSYAPAIADIPESRILDVRARLDTYLKVGWPELDTRPNSVYGDLVLTPLAAQVAAQEIAAENFVSDFDLQQVAAGVIKNCDVVRAFLQNFAAVERENLKATGIVRIAFSTDANVTVDRRTSFLFGTSNVFALRLAESGHLYVKATGTTRSGSNEVVLSQLDATTFVVDVPVMGVMTEAVSDGDTASTDNLLATMTEVTAVGDFHDGSPEETLSVLAARTRETFYSSSLNTRGGAASFVRKEFPGIAGVSAAVSGDTEMLRDTTNALGFRDGRLDVSVRSSQGLLTSTQVVKLVLEADSDSFVGRMALAQTPVIIDSITAETAPALTVVPVILSRSLDPVRAPLATAAYSELEELWLIIPMLRDNNSLPLIPTEVVDGVTFTYFTVTYRFDPGLLHVATTLNSTEVKPVGVDVLTKTFIPAVFASFTVEFIKPAGKQVNIDQARTEILAYFAGLSYPNIYVDSAISDSMLYAGASGVKSITCSASVRWSVASRFLPASADLPSEGVDTAIAASLAPPALTLASTATLTPSYQDVNLGTGTETLVAAGKRNIGYVLDTDDLIFTEYSP